MADFGEYIPMDAVLHSGSPETVHNQFPVLWSEVNRAAVKAAGMESSAVFFSRSSGAIYPASGLLPILCYTSILTRFTGTKSPASSTLFWLGDQLVTFDDNVRLHCFYEVSLKASILHLAHEAGSASRPTTVNLLCKRFGELLRGCPDLSADMCCQDGMQSAVLGMLSSGVCGQLAKVD